MKISDHNVVAMKISYNTVVANDNMYHNAVTKEWQLHQCCGKGQCIGTAVWQMTMQCCYAVANENVTKMLWQMETCSLML